MERDLHHEVRGTGEPLLLVHGTGSSLRVWDPVVERLAARKTVIAVDLPGFGTSPPLTPSEPPPAPAGARLAGAVVAVPLVIFLLASSVERVQVLLPEN
jgi:pimeloyl-ACP methyl ester carboxylesterase